MGIYTFPTNKIVKLRVGPFAKIGDATTSTTGFYTTTPVTQQAGVTAAEATASQLLTSVCAMHSALVGYGLMAGT